MNVGFEVVTLVGFLAISLWVASVHFQLESLRAKDAALSKGYGYVIDLLTSIHQQLKELKPLELVVVNTPKPKPQQGGPVEE